MDTTGHEEPTPRAEETLATQASGEHQAADLCKRLYDELHAMAARAMRREPPGHTLQATAVVNEVCQRFMLSSVKIKSRAHFHALAALIMRRILTDHARKKNAVFRGRGFARISLTHANIGDGELNVDALALDRALAKLEELNPRHAEAIVYKFFGGLTVREIAQVQGISPRTVNGYLSFAKTWLYGQLSK